MPTKAVQKQGKDGPSQKAPDFDDTMERDTGYDPAVDDPEPASPPIADPDTEGQMGQPEDDAEETEEEDAEETEEEDGNDSNFSIGG